MDGSQQSNLDPERCGRGGYTRREWVQTQCGQDTVSTRQCYLFAASLPPHSVTEQVSLGKKCPPPPSLCQGGNQTLKRPATEEAKTEGTALEVTGAID